MNQLRQLTILLFLLTIYFILYPLIFKTTTNVRPSSTYIYHELKQEYKLLLKNHGIILENYFKQDWNEAIKMMDTSKELLNGIMKEYYKILKVRIDIFKKETLPKDWDGVFVATSK